jgi:hypothetical protein
LDPSPAGIDELQLERQNDKRTLELHHWLQAPYRKHPEEPMKLLGVIRAESDPPGIDRFDWRDLILNCPDLSPDKPSTIINPFTRKPVPCSPDPDVARVVVKGRIGRLSWSDDEKCEIDVSGNPAIIPIARYVAKSLGGVFKEIPAKAPVKPKHKSPTAKLKRKNRS